MLRYLATLLLLASTQHTVVAKNPYGKGFIGYGIKLYEPACGFSCAYQVSAPLNCSLSDLPPPAPDSPEEDPSFPSGKGWKVTATPSPKCQANNLFFLQSVAYCLDSHCRSNLSSAELESFWGTQVPPSYEDPTIHAKITFAQALELIHGIPTKFINATELLNFTGKVPEETFATYYHTMSKFASNEVTHEKYSLIIFLTGAVLPIGLSLLRILPWPTSIATKFNAFVIDPPLLANPPTFISKLFLMPTRGQTLFVAYLFIINIVLTACGYEMIADNVWYPGRVQTWTYVANRCGILTLANVPLVLLYAGRNSVLLWVTNWSRTTFLLIHRYTALICVIQAVLHSTLYLNIALRTEGWETEFTEPYWYYGCAATIAFSLLILLSLKPIREKAYELFIALHIILCILAIAAAYKHFTLKYLWDYGFQNYTWMAVAIWGFDRVLRIGRQVRHGAPRAYITPVDDEYYRVDVPGVSASGYVYLHFPMVSKWRMWESHPFSVAAVRYTNDSTTSTPSSPTVPEITEITEIEPKTAAVASSSSSTSQATPAGELGIVFFVRRHKGLTRKLAERRTTRVLVESSYGHNFLSLHDETSPSTKFPNVICIAGGVGITGVLPALGHFNGFQQVGSKKLYWGVRTMPLVHAVQDMLGVELAHWPGVDVTLSVGARLSLKSLLEKDLSEQKGTMVVVCGPQGMVDDVNCIVSGFSRHNRAAVKLVVESFSW